MAPRSKSVFRQPGAKHFQLVHRSQRDPLFHDPEASQRVLKQVVRENDKKGKSKADLEAIIAPTDIQSDRDAHIGEAAMYGIYYDDSKYDYMQHLRPVGVQEEGVENMLIEAPPSSAAVNKGKKGGFDIALKDEIPLEALPSKYEMPRTYDSQQAVPDSISGFQPEMDPHLRQVLEALEDDAFVEDELEEDFFGELVKEGARASDEEVEFDFYEGGEPSTDASTSTAGDDEDSWEARFAKFKMEQKTQPQPASSDDDGDMETEMADTISGLPTFSVIGGKGKKRRKGSSGASGHSMSSSSMYRNENLQNLDERFDQLMMNEYGSGEEEEDLGDSDDDEAPQLITARDDFAAMIEELDSMELLGRRMRPKLTGESGAEKLETLRTAMGQDERVRDGYLDDDDSNSDDIYDALKKDDKDLWDCETILTTYSNLENHPRLIRARTMDARPVKKIVLDRKTGMPSVQGNVSQRPRGKQTHFQDDEDTEESSNEDTGPRRTTVARARDESKDDKKARKAAVKAEKSSRRAEKKASKTAFNNEMMYQAKAAAGKGTERMRKL